MGSLRFEEIPFDIVQIIASAGFIQVKFAPILHSNVVSLEYLKEEKLF